MIKLEAENFMLIFTGFYSLIEKMKKKPLVIVGNGLFAEEISDLISTTGKYEIIAFIEGIDRAKCNRLHDEIPVLWVDDIRDLNQETKFIGAIGSPKRNGIIRKLQQKGYCFTSFIHPSSTVFPSAVIGEGSVIGINSIISAKTAIGRHTIINRGCLIGHHVRIGNFVTVSPGANIAGKVIVNDGAYIGMGSIIIDGITVGTNSIVGAGAVVTKNVPDNVLVVGVPARITKSLV